MPAPACTDSEFIDLFESIGPVAMAERLGVSIRPIFDRRARLELKHQRPIAAPDKAMARRKHVVDAPQRVDLDIADGFVLVGGDAHYWPNQPKSAAHRGLVAATRRLKPTAIVMNGDVFDGASVSRHARIGWEERPTVVDEIEVCKERLEEIREAAPKGCHLIWTLGNHDARFETRLANMAPEYARVNGVHLKDHFPWWEGCWSCWINDEVVIKHRFKGGIHATHNNTMWSGKSIVTNHLHSQKTTPFTDYNGTRWGVDTGCIAAVGGAQFMDYLEDNPVNWRSGFVALRFVEGRMLQPMLAMVADEKRGLIDFCGQLYEV